MKKRIYIIAIVCFFVLISFGLYFFSRASQDNTDNPLNYVTANGKGEVIEKENSFQDNKKETEDILIYSDIEKVHELAEVIDFTVILKPITISQEEDIIYKKAYLEILKNNIPRINSMGEVEYFRDLYFLGEFEDYENDFTYYYYDLDGDGLPELGIKSTAYTYILKYDIEKNEFSVLYSGPTMYITILGTGQIWYRDDMRPYIRRSIYIVLNDNNEWENVIEFQEGRQDEWEFFTFYIGGYNDVLLEEDYFIEIRDRFFNAIENAIPSATFDEVFGDLKE